MKDNLFLFGGCTLVLMSTLLFIISVILYRLKRNENRFFLHGAMMELMGGSTICYVALARETLGDYAELQRIEILTLAFFSMLVLYFLKQYVTTSLRLLIDRITGLNICILLLLIFIQLFFKKNWTFILQAYLYFLFLVLLLVLMLLLKNYVKKKNTIGKIWVLYIVLLFAMCETYRLLFCPASGQLFFFLGFFFFFIYQLWTLYLIMKKSVEQAEQMEKTEKAILHDRELMLLSSIQPGLLHDSLIAIKKECEENANKAAGDITLFARFLRGNLDAISYPGNISLQTELAHARTYLEFEQMRYGNDIELDLKDAEGEVSIPPLTIQRLCELIVTVCVKEGKKGCRIIVITKEELDYLEVLIFGECRGDKKPESFFREDVSQTFKLLNERLSESCAGTLEMEILKERGIEFKILIPFEEMEGN